MKRLLEIYSQLNALDEFLVLMLKQPDNYRRRIIRERVTALVAHIEHVNFVMCRQNELGCLCEFETFCILPAVSEICLQVGRLLSGKNVPQAELPAHIAWLISRVNFYLSRIGCNNEQNKGLH
ncbi:hypothetical protein DP590_25390 [Salmonella enterica]|nr:hypothetical protein [Salmonella enterica]ECE0740255.1 hypothetical protein [Salmonella enterica subsp. enterica serovar Hvittingfoss]HEC8062319.1 hypothetical protein [Salmonella enterica subsp. enterica serovar Potsdam]EGA8118227.1 hypothetical protein [Salmonella enterica]EHO8673506.1 hypothetical protein [Salmonella enterica]